MDQFQNAIKKARDEMWEELEKAYTKIKSKEDKLLEYIYLHLIKEIHESKIRLGDNKKSSTRYLDIENNFTVIISLNDDMDKYMKKEDDVEVLKQNDFIHISCYPKGKITPSCIESVKITDVTLDSLVKKIRELVSDLRKKLLKE